MKVLMIGWELPPHNSGGLGEASLGLARALVKEGIEVEFVLPKKVDLSYPFMKISFANVTESETYLNNAYNSSSLRYKLTGEDPIDHDYVKGALGYADQIRRIVEKSNFDIIHAHDWLCFPAGLEAKRLSGKPLVAHFHATEYDRSGGHYTNNSVYEIERQGALNADSVVSVSNYTKDILVQNYEATASKVTVVHNGSETVVKPRLSPALIDLKKLGYKVVLFLGRITLQKGPEYFVKTAKLVSHFNEKTIFVVTGSGDMQEQMMGEVYHQGMSDRFIFTGFLRGEDRDRIFQTADVFVMPSVSEPFGITPLEAISNKTPVIVSKQSGVVEVLQHVLKVDFWDIEETANKILSVISDKALKDILVVESGKELKLINWSTSAEKCVNLYNSLVSH